MICLFKMVMTSTWFKKAVMQKSPYTLGGWNKTQSARVRRSKALSSRPKNRTLNNRRLSVARALLALSNVTRDNKTKLLARRDAYYFLNLLKK